MWAWLGRWFLRLWRSAKHSEVWKRRARLFAGEDFLDGDGKRRVDTAGEGAPRGPRSAPLGSLDFEHPKVRHLAQSAALFLFEQFELGFAPPHFWAFLDAFRDPSVAMKEFLSAIGCDHRLIRNGDVLERKKAAEVIDILTLSGDVLAGLSLDARRELASVLASGEYERVREAAKISRQLRIVLDIRDKWSGSPIIPSFEALLDTVKHLADNPLRATVEDASSAAGLARDWSDAQSDYDAYCARYENVFSALKACWPHDIWAGRPEEKALKSAKQNFDQVAEWLAKEKHVSIDDMRAGIDQMVKALEVLDQLLSHAEAFNSTGSSGHHGGGGSYSRRDRGGRAKAHIEPYEEALRYFGFSMDAPPSASELRKAMSTIAIAIHPDHVKGDDEEMKKCNDEMKKCNEFYSIAREFIERRGRYAA